jgi:acyl-CoA reductase-like NAD-dependent aldehyde dehydrogenase
LTLALGKYLATANLNFISTESQEKYLKEVSSEGGEALYNEKGVALIKDFNMCSELQQDYLGVPLVFLCTVKYGHEMAKWSNTGYLSLTHSIWGSDLEKAKRLARKLETDSVYLNHWSPTGKLPFGLKSSSFGLDPRLSSTFCYPYRIES